MSLKTRSGTISRSRRLYVEQFESRTLPSVVFTPGPYRVPLNRPDVALGPWEVLPIEPAVSVNRADPGNLAVSSQNQLQLSTNAGGTFSAARRFPGAGLPGVIASYGDSSTAFDAEGRLFWTNLLRFPQSRDVTVAQLDPSTAARIGTPSRVPTPPGLPNDDKPCLVADTDPTGISPYRNNLYVAFSRLVTRGPSFQWRAFFARSTDQAGSWTNVRQLSTDAEGLTWGSTVASAPNGDVYVAYHSQPDVRNGDMFEFDGFRHNPDGRSGQVIVFRSTDGGATFRQSTAAFTPGQADVTFNAQDADNSGNIPGTQFWTAGSAQPWVLADPVRPGTIYVITADDPDNVHGAGDDADVVLARSTDYGLTWTLSTVEPGPVDEPGTINNSFQLFPTAAIDPFGNLVVAWYDNRRGLSNAAGRFLLDVFAKYSTDGGLTWSDAFMVNDPSNPFDPDAGAFRRFDPPGGPPTTRIGEYFGLDLFGGTAYVAWNGNTSSGNEPVGQQVWFSSFAIQGSLTINGTDGDDTVVVRSVPDNPDFVQVSVNGRREYVGLWSGLTGITINGFAGDDLILVEDTVADVPVTIDGGAGRNSLAGPDAVNIWRISGADAGTLSSISLGSPVRFTAVQNLAGGADADTFVFDDGGTLSGFIDGRGGINALDYAAYTTDVAVILPNYSATGVGGVFHIRDVTGGRGPGSNILVGDGGHNVLRGGSGRDLLIAGAGPGMLLGGDGEDILIGGSTTYDTDPVALRAIMDEWLRTDQSYEERVDHLMNGGGRSDPYLLNRSTVSGNGGGNTLKGESGRDWFFGDLMREDYDWDELTELFLAI